MNYFQDHIGDYAAATAHLSWDEDLAYTRLIRAYYHHEKPIPNDISLACRLIRAQNKIQRQAVETVLNEFFKLEDDGWHQKRCDLEIASFHDKKNKAKASANTRWANDKTHSESNAIVMRSHSEGNANQEPRTNILNKQSSKYIQDSSDKKKPTAEFLALFDIITNPTDEYLKGWQRDLITTEHIETCILKARKYKPKITELSTAYLDKIIREKPKASGVQWWADEKLIIKKREELGLKPIRAETWQQLIERIKKHLK